MTLLRKLPLFSDFEPYAHTFRAIDIFSEYHPPYIILVKLTNQITGKFYVKCRTRNLADTRGNYSPSHIVQIMDFLEYLLEYFKEKSETCTKF